MTLVSPHRLRWYQRTLTPDGMGGFTESYTPTSVYIRAYISRPTAREVEIARQRDVQLEWLAHIIPMRGVQFRVGDRLIGSEGETYTITEVIQRSHTIRLGLANVG